MEQWKRRMGDTVLLLLAMAPLINSCRTARDHPPNNGLANSLDGELFRYVDDLFDVENATVFPGLGLERINVERRVEDVCVDEGKSLGGVEEYFYKRLEDFSKTHVLAFKIPETARFFNFATGKSSFMAGFGMGFLAFALKKLLLPVFIGAQLVKSVLIAMFLPSILGSLGKIVGKGLSTFSGVSGSSAGLGGLGAGGNQHVEDFEFKDTGPYNNNEAAESGLSINVATSTETSQQAMNRYGQVNSLYGNSQHSDNYYLRQPNKKTDYKVFHRIPTSSLLLTTYDPFYSPLLSRLDAVFLQLGLGDGKTGAAGDAEKCRERLICMMYANPAKYAPYSNLVSAQLSRELNELRKPASDNPEILRFFKYMKAAKDGQDGEECLAHGGCPRLSAQQQSPAMLTTFNDINKLVQARKFQ